MNNTGSQMKFRASLALMFLLALCVSPLFANPVGTADEETSSTNTPLLEDPNAQESSDKSNSGPAYNDQFMEEILNLVNIERAKVGAGALCMNKALTNAALLHSLDQYNNQKMSHTGSDGSNPGDRIARQNYGSLFTWGENVAYWYQTPASVMNAWMNSAGHRANILNPDFSNLGVGFVGFYWTQKFAGPIGFSGCDIPNNDVVLGCDNLVSGKVNDNCGVCGGDGSSCQGPTNICRVKSEGVDVATACSSFKWHCKYFSCDTSTFDITCSDPAKLLADANDLFQRYYEEKGVCSKSAGEIVSSDDTSPYDPFGNTGSEPEMVCRIRTGVTIEKACSTIKWTCSAISCSTTVECTAGSLVDDGNRILNDYYKQKKACSRSIGEVVTKAVADQPYSPFGPPQGPEEDCLVRNDVSLTKLCSTVTWTCKNIDCTGLDQNCGQDILNTIPNASKILSAYHDQKGKCSSNAGVLAVAGSDGPQVANTFFCRVKSTIDGATTCTQLVDFCSAYPQFCPGKQGAAQLCPNDAEAISNANEFIHSYYFEFIGTKGRAGCEDVSMMNLVTGYQEKSTSA
eukprot:Nk52_evm36s164 gene=Nk52_evmTU36s164